MDNRRDEFKKIGSMLEKKMFEISDDDMINVTGGFAETNKSLPTAGYEIMCPICKTTDPDDFNSSVSFDKVQNAVKYTCKRCGPFRVVDGYAITEQNWRQWCKDNKYNG